MKIEITKYDENGNPIKAKVSNLHEGDTFVHPLNRKIGYVVDDGELIKFERN